MTPPAHIERANAFKFEPQLGDGDIGCGTEGLCDLCSEQFEPVFVVEDVVQVRVAVGDVLS